MPGGSSASVESRGRATSSGSSVTRTRGETSGVVAVLRALSSSRPAKTGVIQRSEGAASIPATVPAINTAASMTKNPAGSAVIADLMGTARAGRSRRPSTSTIRSAPSIEARNSGRSPRIAAAASTATVGSAEASRLSVSTCASRAEGRWRYTRESNRPPSPPQAGQSPRPSGSGPPQRTQRGAGEGASLTDRDSASSSAEAVGNRSSGEAAVARATTSSSQSGTVGVTCLGR